ncbi:6556_t:CDS:1, partial [Racocetra fulgida]
MCEDYANVVKTVEYSLIKMLARTSKKIKHLNLTQIYNFDGIYNNFDEIYGNSNRIEKTLEDFFYENATITSLKISDMVFNLK